MASKPVSLKEQEIFHLQRWQNVNISSKLKNNFEKFGFQPRNTIVWKFRNFNGKYGEEGDRLIFKILNLGLFG
jgi:hypothetical protein